MHAGCARAVPKHAMVGIDLVLGKCADADGALDPLFQSASRAFGGGTGTGKYSGRSTKFWYTPQKASVRFGFQTILWGPQDNLREALPLIRQAGFTGVEVAQPPDTLGPFAEFIRRLDDLGLQLIGLAGGTLDQRMRYMPAGFLHGKNKAEQPYLYIDKWEAFKDKDQVGCERGIENGYRLALHPHYPERATRLDYVWQLLKEQPKLEWLPDTAHLYIAWADLRSAFTTMPGRLAGVHVKDWTSIFGRATYNVAKGFIEPGAQGEVFKNFDLWRALRDAHFGDKWIVMEIDYARFSAEQSVWDCAEWLAKQSTGWTGPRKRTPAPSNGSSENQHPTKNRAVDLLPALWPAASDTPEVFYATAAQRLYEKHDCVAVSIWAYNYINDDCVHAAHYPVDRKFGDDVFLAGRHFSRETAHAAYPRRIDLQDGRTGSEKHRASYLKEGIHYLISAPVLATYNKHQVRFVIHYLLAEAPSRWPEMCDELRSAGATFGRVADLYVAELSQRASSRTSAKLDEPNDLHGMFNALARLIRDEIHCEGVSIFRADIVGSELREAGSTGIDWGDTPLTERKYLREDKSLTSRPLRERRPFIEVNTDTVRRELGLNPKQKSAERVREKHLDKKVCAFIPLYGSRGKLLGVVRCRNKVRSDGEIYAFTEDDLAIVEAICRTAAPLLEMRIAAEQRMVATHRLFHELKAPLGAARGAVHLAQVLVDRSAPKLFPQPYLADAQSWMDLMIRLLQNPMDSKDILSPKPRRTLLYKDVIIPAVRRAEDDLKEQRLSAGAIDYGNEEAFAVIPPLNIDPNMFQQVFFNLLTNSIKYRGNQGNFRVEIRPAKTVEGFEISFRDWGLGIQEGWEEAIFEEGVRGKEAAQSDVQGRGLGLWFVRQILARHDCRIWVSSLNNPTELTIFIPKSRIAAR